MSKIIIQTYGKTEISGRHIPTFENGAAINQVFVADENVIYIEGKADKQIILSNKKDVKFRFSISNKNKIVANVEYREKAVYVNDNWSITENRVSNRMIRQQSQLVTSANLSFIIDADNTRSVVNNRLDIRLNDGHFAALMFTDQELLLVRFNGNFVFARMAAFLEQNLNRNALRNTWLRGVQERYAARFPNFEPGVFQEFIEGIFEQVGDELEQNPSNLLALTWTDE